MRHSSAAVRQRPPSVVVLGGGEVLLSGRAVADVGRALTAVARQGARDGVGLSEGLRELLEGIALAQFRARNTPSETEYRDDDERVEVAETVWIDTKEAAVLMGCDERNVRGLCGRRSLLTARKTGGRWVVDRAEVLRRAEGTAA